MKYIKKISLVVPIIFIASFCSTIKEDVKSNNFIIKESYQTKRNEADNVDSPTFWKTEDNKGWLISTAKATDQLLVNDATTGEFIRTVGKSGSNEIEFKRPNGISVIDSLVFVVERDNKRIQVLGLPNFNFITFIGQDDLIKPYGIYIDKIESTYKVYVTDNYESVDENIPADSLLNERVLVYQFSFSDTTNLVSLEKKFGETEGEGTLKIVESIYGDPKNNNLLIAEEKEDETCIKVYDMKGQFKSKVIGKGLFKYQVEGIALYKKSENDGFWIITDQDLSNNTFHIFSRKEFNHLGSFQLPNTTNTDGIWLTQASYQGFDKGAFFAVHNDGNVSGVDLKLILEKFYR